MDRTSSGTPSRPGSPGPGPRPRSPAGVINPDVINPDVINPDVINPDVINPDVIDPDDDLPGSYGGTGRRDATAAPQAVATDTPPPRPRRAGGRSLAVVGGGLIVAIVIIAVLAYQLGSGRSTAASAPATSTAPSTTTSASTLPATDIFQLAAPSVVVVTTAKGSLGTGVIVTATGTVLTANHVVSDGSAVNLTFSDGTKSKATVASSNPAADVATLTPAGLPEIVVPATLGGGVQVGADVVAIGNPLGFTDSTSRGIVSGLDRTANTKVGKFSGLIQFDAAVNPGSSGGPLLNNQGLVVGIVVSLANAAEDDSFAGIGFAVPIGTALGGGADGSGDGPQL